MDNAGMVMDFGLMNVLKEIVDSFDHSHDMWNKESKEMIDFFRRENERWVILPFNPTAEMLSLMFFAYAKYIIDHTIFKNNEGDVKVYSVCYHETATGYAEADALDYERIWLPGFSLADIEYSEGIIKDWSPLLRNLIEYGQKIENPDILLQITADE